MRADAAQAAEFAAFFSAGWDAEKPEGFVAHFLPRMHPELRLVAPLSPELRGREGFREFARSLFSLFPDYHVRVEDSAAEGDVIYLRVTHSATIGRRRREWDGVDRIILREGLVLERIAYFDPATLVAAIARTPRIWVTAARWGRARARG